MTGIPESPAIPADVPAAPKRGGGPRTPEGKLRSRRNSLKHGLRSEVVLPADLAEALDRRTAEFTADFRPRTSYAAFLVRDMALASVRLDRCAEMCIVDDDRVRRRARLIWGHDRRMAVEGLGAKLAKDPTRVAPALRGCKQGADWLRERWESLGEILTNKGAWTDEQRRLAFDLLGVPPAPARRRPDAAAAGRHRRAGGGGRRADRRAGRGLRGGARRGRCGGAGDGDVRHGAGGGRGDGAAAEVRGECRRAFHAAKAELLRLREAEAEAEAARGGPPPSHKAPLTGAAVDFLAKRSREANQARAAARLEQMTAAASAEKPAPAPVVERPVATAAPAPRLVPTAAPLNRHERRAQAKRDRQADRRAGR